MQVEEDSRTIKRPSDVAARHLSLLTFYFAMAVSSDRVCRHSRRDTTYTDGEYEEQNAKKGEAGRKSQPKMDPLSAGFLAVYPQQSPFSPFLRVPLFMTFYDVQLSAALGQ